MLKTRVIPCLLLSNRGLVKTVRFKNPTYIGDPINAVKIFNDKGADELIFLDIDASTQKREPDFKLISEITSECFMPLGYGGGIKSEDQIARLLKIGVEKVIINSAATDLRFIKSATQIFGSSTIVGSIDVKKQLWGTQKVYTHSGTRVVSSIPLDYALRLEQSGVGEIIINSIDHDGKMQGYDLDLISTIANKISIPLVVCGGAGSLQDFVKAVDCGASAVAAGSLFIFKGPNRAVLINYPSIQELNSIIK